MFESIKRLVLRVLPGAAIGLVFAVPSLAAGSEIKACYQDRLASCCSAAKDVDLTVECSLRDLSWVCTGSVEHNPLVLTTERSATGFRFAQQLGTETCEYRKPECGSTPGACKLSRQVTSSTCAIKEAAGPVCKSPRLLAAALEPGSGEFPVSECEVSE